jgi:GT2 family glycosyltransferase
LIFALSVVALWSFLFVRGVQGILRMAPISPALGGSGVVSAFVPARNEAEVIEACVRGLDAQGDLLERIFVIDDGSTDGTGEKLATLAARVPRLTVLAGRGPGPGECGKPAALRDAVSAASPSSEWLLFVDADVVLAPGAVAALLGAGSAADLVSGFPRLVLPTALEKIVMPSVGAVVVAMNPPARRPFANGQLILARRRVYEAAGGHVSVVREILEDVRLAERVHAVGGRIRLVDARRIAHTRMYSSWPEMREGWSKNLYLLAGARPAAVWKWASLTVLLGWSGVLAVIVAGAPWGAAAYGITLAMQMTLRALGGASWLWSVFAPFGSLATAYLLLRSMRLHRRREAIAWKGRSYAP